MAGSPFPHEPTALPRRKKKQLAAALEVVHENIREGKILGPFPGRTRTFPGTGHPLYIYLSLQVPNSKPGTYRWVLNASHNRGGSKSQQQDP